MASYDENLYENPFFLALTTRNKSLWKSAVEKKLTILVPQKRAIPKEINEELLSSHILDADPGQEELYYNLLGQEILCCDHNLTLCSRIEGQLYESVKLLFEETFVTEDDKSYRVLCIDQLLTVIRQDSFQTHEEPEPPINYSTLPSTSKSPYINVKHPSSVTLDDENSDFCNRVLFGAEKDFRLETRLQNACLNFARKLAKGYQRSWSPKMVTNQVTTEFKSLLRLVLKRRKRLNTGRLDPREVDCVKLATEIYFFNIVGKTILSILRGCFVEEDGELNRARNITEKLTPQDLAVNPKLYDSIPGARKELLPLNDAITPHARLICLRRTIVALSKDRKKVLNSQKENEAAPDRLSSDDLLPALVYLVIKCSTINDWCANVSFMGDFHFSKAAGDELGYCLASFEAATQYIKDNSLLKSAINSELTNNLYSGFSLSRQSSVEEANAERETSSLRVYVTELIRDSDDVLLTEFYQQQRALEEIEMANPHSDKCHPLCDCPECSNDESSSICDPDTSGLIDPEPTVVNPDSFLTTTSRTALHLAALLGKTTVVNALCKLGATLDMADDKGQTPMHLACYAGSQSCTLLLLHLGANSNVFDHQNNTPLHIAAYYGHPDCVKAIVYYDKQIKKSNLDLNAVNSLGETPLHIAVRYQQAEIVRVLLECGVKLHVKNNRNERAADLCNNLLIQQSLLAEDSTLDFMLVINSADLPQNYETLSLMSEDDYHSVKSHQSEDSEDNNSVFLSPNPSTSGFHHDWAENWSFDMRKIDRMLRAVADNDLPMVKFYIGENQESDKTCHPLCQCEKCKQISEDKKEQINVNIIGSNGYAPIHVAAEKGQLEMMKFLIDVGADITILTNGTSETPLHLAVRNNNEKIVRALLLDYGADSETRNGEGETALHWAAGRGENNMLQLLCQLGADVHAINSSGDTGLHLAVKTDRSDVVETLLSNGASPFACNAVRLMPADLTTNPEIRDLLDRFEHACDANEFKY